MLSSPLAIRADDEQQRIVQNYLRQLGASDEINILEAGCGRYWPFDLQGARYKLTGVDADKHALEHRKNAEKDLDDAILADLRSLDLPSNTYDVIYNAFVLEHIDGAEQVLQKFLNWLKPNGSLIVSIPDRYSAYGFFAHHTPHWLHVFFYRYILGSKNAGKPGFCPYPTFYDTIVSREGIREFARNNELTIREECGFYIPPPPVGLLMRIINFLSFGRLAADHCNLLYILVKPAKGIEATAQRPKPGRRS
jgi:SAM-dependent methyltransferase